jgi:hypothetical protein
MLMADAAQVANRKLFILGGGISIVPARPVPLAVVMLIRVPWDQADTRHEWLLELLDQDHSPVLVGDDQPLLVSGEFEAHRSEDLMPGTSLDVPVAINFGTLSLEGGGRYIWRLSIDGETEDDWRIGFSVRPAEVEEA